jgi:hypothetical protein
MLKKEKIEIKVRKKKGKQKKNITAQIGTNVRARGFNAWLLAGSQFAFGRSCDQPTRGAGSPCLWGIWVREPYTETKVIVKERN